MVDGLSSPLSGSCIEVYTHIYYIYTIQACFYSGVIFWVFVTPEKRRRFRWCFQPQQQQKREDKKEKEPRKELHLLCRGKIYRFAITTMQLLYFVVYKWSRALTLSCGITSYNIYIIIYTVWNIFIYWWCIIICKAATEMMWKGVDMVKQMNTSTSLGINNGLSITQSFMTSFRIEKNLNLKKKV